MKRLSLLTIFAIFFLGLIFSLSFAQPKPGTQPKTPAGPGIPSGPGVTIPDDPVIREFTGPTYPVVQGSEVTLRWRVEPGAGGSPITSVNIVASYLPAPEVPFRPIGEHKFLFLGGDYAEERTFRLTATNRAGRSASRTLSVRHILIRDALGQLEMSLQANPPEFRAGRPVHFELLISNREGAPLIGMNIIVTQGGKTVASLSDVRLGHGGTGILRLVDTGYMGTPGDYTVDVEYRSVHRLKQFRTVPAPYFTIAPTS